MLTDADIPEWVLDDARAEDLRDAFVPPMPDWPAFSAADLALLTGVAECPCCVEPVAPGSLTARAESESVPWATPGVFGHIDPSPRPPITALVAAVTDAVAGLAACDPTSRDDLQILVDVEALTAAFGDLRIRLLPFLADAHTRRLHVAAGHPTLTSWRARQFPDLPPTDLTLAGRLRRLPVLDAAVRDRTVALDAARRTASSLLTLAQHLDKPDGLIDGQPAEAVISAIIDNTLELIAGGRAGIPDDDPLLLELQAATAAISDDGGSQLHRVEQAFTLLAAHVHADALPAALNQQRDALLPNELERRAQNQSDRRGLRLEKRLDDLPGDVRITPDHELYELLWTLLHAAATHDPANPQDTATRAAARATRPGDHSDPDRQDPLLRDLDQDLQDSLNDAENDDRDAGITRPRGKAQRLHDALKLILQQHLAAGLAGSLDKAPVAITVTIPSQKLEQHPGALPARGRSGTTLPMSLLRQWWCNANVTAYVLTRGLIPLGLVHTGRTLSATERAAAHLQRGRLCDGLGCCRPDDPLRTLTPHHLYAWSEYGRTSLAETIMACDRLHQDLHHGRTVQLRDGRWINQSGPTTPPDPGPWHC